MPAEFLVFIVVMLGLSLLAWRKLSGRSGLPPIQITPDVPVSFGYKISWLAVQGCTPTDVAQILGQSDPRYTNTKFEPCNWASGMARIQHSFLNREIFISPPIQGWVFVLNWNPRDEMKPNVTAALEALSTKGRAGFFSSQRVSSYAAWALAEHGKLFRHLSEADFETYANFGALSEFERPELLTSADLKMMDVSLDQEEEFYDRLPDEADVIAVAAKFSLDPTELAHQTSVGLGLIGR